MESIQALVNWLAENESAFSAVAAIAVIAGVVYGALRFVLAPILRARSLRKQQANNQGGNAAAASSAVAPTASQNHQSALSDTHDSLAVLLFEALSENKDDEFLASGITSEVIAHVTQVPNIRVSSRLSSFTYKAGRDDINLVAEQLNTRFILTGSLRRAGQRIFVIAQLTDTESQSEVWAQTYDREIEDLFDVQHDIAKCIVGAVLGEVKHAESMLAGTTPDHQLDAWGLVQKAYYFWLSNFSAEGVLAAIEYLRQAIKLDGGYASARAALAMLISQTMTARISKDYEASLAETRELIEQAYQAAPNDIDVLENAGVVWMNIGEPKRAEMALRKVNQMAPLNLVARGYLALLRAMVGEQEGATEALQLIKENFTTAPHHPSAPYWYFFQAVAEQVRGNHQQAIEYANQSLLGQPNWVHSYFVIANAQGELGDCAAAEHALGTVEKINPYLSTALFADNIYRITGGAVPAMVFLGGLKKCNLL